MKKPLPLLSSTPQCGLTLTCPYPYPAPLPSPHISPSLPGVPATRQQLPGTHRSWIRTPVPGLITGLPLPSGPCLMSPLLHSLAPPISPTHLLTPLRPREYHTAQALGNPMSRPLASKLLQAGTSLAWFA